MANRFWKYTDMEYESWKERLPQFHEDEYHRRTLLIPCGSVSYVVALWRCKKDICMQMLTEPIGYRMSWDPSYEVKEDYMTMLDYYLDVHKVSRHKLPVWEYLGWTRREWMDYQNLGVIPTDVD